ncbi:MAG: hypothetical protein LBC02_12400 [Planctomycetaceae bacterium]|nr:hypothetical protein [Planctomycetaceae bacterium]
MADKINFPVPIFFNVSEPENLLLFGNYSVVVKSFHFFVMAGGNETQRSDRLPCY